MELHTMTGRMKGFTFIELILVMTVLALIIGIVTPNYFKHLDESREVVLKNNLFVVRQAIDDYYADNGKYPTSLNTLVDNRYIKIIPHDPFTKSNETWKIIAPSTSGGVFDIISGSDEKSLKGIPYADF